MAPAIASREPCTSDLMTTGSSLAFALLDHRRASARGLPRPWVAAEVSRLVRSRNSAISRARSSLSTTTMSSPASGVPLRPSTSTGVEGPASSIALAALVDQGAHAAPLAAGDEDVADLERAALDQNGRHRAAAALHFGFDHRAARRCAPDWRSARAARTAGGSPPPACRGRSSPWPRPRRHSIVAAQILNHHVVLQQLLLDPVRIGLGPVDLVDRDDDRHLRPPWRG